MYLCRYGWRSLCGWEIFVGDSSIGLHTQYSKEKSLALATTNCHPALITGLILSLVKKKITTIHQN